MQTLTGKYCKDAKIFAETIEEEALQTIYDIVNHPAFEGSKIRIQPDCHQGLGIVIGFTAELTNYVNPNHVGVDIGCRISSTIYDNKLNKEDYPIVEARVKKTIPMGFNIASSRQFEMKEFLKFMNSKMSYSRASWPEMVENIQVDEKYITKMLQRIGMDEGIFYKSISSAGGGNHFCEYGETPEGHGVWTVHCGSRNLGQKVAKYWEKVSKSAKRNKEAEKELKNKIKEIKKTFKGKDIEIEINKLKRECKMENQFLGYLTGEDMKGYLTDLFFAQAYAEWNHKIIHRKINEIMLKLGCKPIEEIASTHNYINPVDHIIRKGSITAYEDEKIIIPFNMRDGLAICKGKSNPDWNYSAPHGAGRLMSRAKAKASIDLKDFEKSMEGIYSTSVCRGTLDESPMAYKDMNEIIKLIEPTCEILYFVKPLINIKATEPE